MPNYVKARLQVSGENTKELIDSLCAKNEKREKWFDFNKIIPMPEELHIVCGGVTDACMRLFINSLRIGFSEHTKYSKAYLDYTTKEWRAVGAVSLIMDEHEYNSTIAELLERYKEKDGFGDDPQFFTEDDILKYGKRALDNYLIYGYVDWYRWSIDHWGTKWNACDSYITEDAIEFSTAWSNIAKLIVELSIQHPDYEFYYEYADEDTGCQVGYIRVKGGEFIESVAFDDGSKEAYEQAFRIWGCEDDFVYDENEGTYKYREDE